MTHTRPAHFLAALLLAAGCQTVSPARQEVTTLYFGLGGEGKTVTAAQWDAFVDGEIVPRFPDGFTVLDAHGHWQDKSVGYAEPSRVVVLVHPHLSAIDAKLNDLREIYRRRFGQTSVLRVDQTARHVSF